MKHPSAEGIWNEGLTRCVSCDCRPRPADMKNSGCDRVWDIEIYNSSMFTEPHIRYDGLPPKNDAGVRYAERFFRFRAARMPVRMRVGRKADGTRPAVSYSPGRAAPFRFLTLFRCPSRSSAPSGLWRQGDEALVCDRILPGIALFGPGAFPSKGEGGLARARRRARFGSVRPSVAKSGSSCRSKVFGYRRPTSYSAESCAACSCAPYMTGRMS